MKVIYRYGISSLSGKLDGMVHSAFRGGRLAVVKKFVKPAVVENSNIFGARKHNIAGCWRDCSEGFKEDMNIYAQRRISYTRMDKIPAYAGYAHFVRFLYQFAKSNESIDLAAVDKTELEGFGCPVTVAGAVSEGFLPEVHNACELINEW